MKESLEAETRAWLVAHGTVAGFSHGTVAGFSPEIVRAANEGRMVRKAVTDEVCTRLDNFLLQLREVVDTATSYKAEERTGVPSAAAYALYDALVAATELAVTLSLPDIKIAIGPIARHDIAQYGDPEWRTGVEITVSQPWLEDDLTVTALCEPADRIEDEAD